MSLVAGAVAAMLLLLVAVLHAYWALGGVWPGQDRESLARMVVGGPPGMAFPSRSATWAVVAVLVMGATTVLAAARLVAPPLPSWLLRDAALVGAAILLIRALEGFFDTRLRPNTVGSPFVRLNRLLFSPLCLVLASLVVLAALG